MEDLGSLGPASPGTAIRSRDHEAFALRTARRAVTTPWPYRPFVINCP